MKEEFVNAVFINEVAQAVEERFGKGFQVQFYEIIKDENKAVPTAAVCEPGAKTSVAVHIDQLLAGLECGEISLTDAVRKVVRICEEVQNVSSYVDVITTPDRSTILRNVSYQLIHTEKNVRKLLKLPHKELLDLSAVYKVTVKDDGIETASILVDNETCERTGISERELDDAANLNTEMNGFRTQTFTAVFPGILDGMDRNTDRLWVLANRAKQEGAVVLFYPGYFGKLARRLGKNLYVMMPSGHNEVIAAPAEDGITPDDLRMVVSKIDSARNNVSEGISNVYRYRYRTHKWEIVSRQ